MSEHPDYGCHYTWDWLTEHLNNKSLQYIRDRIESLDREVEFQEEEQTVKRDLPRLYALKGFLTHSCGVINKCLIKEGRDFLEKALRECGDSNLGYRYVIISNLKHIVKDHGKKLEYANKLKEISNFDDSDILQEVHAMQAYAAGHFHLRQRCIEHYKKAGKSRAEWCFGLALANEKNNSHSPSKSSSEKWQEILVLLDDAIRLDESYIDAKLKKAKIIFCLEKSEHANTILQGILKDHKDSLKIKEEVALAYAKYEQEIAIDLLKECYNTNNQRQKSLRGLGVLYENLWNSSRSLENLELSIKYRTELVDKTDNSKIFDLTCLADTLLQKYNKKNEKIETIYTKIIDELNEKQLNTSSEIETCYQLAKYYRVLNIENEEITYLGKIFEKDGEAKFENNSKTLELIDKAKKRLQQLIEKDHPKSFEFKVWLMKSEEEYQGAIESLDRKVKEEGIKDLDKQFVLKEKASCYVDWIQNQRTSPEINRALLNDLEGVMSKIKVGDESKLNYIHKLIPEHKDTKKMKFHFGNFIKNIQDIKQTDKELYLELIKEAKLVLDRTIHYLYIVAVPDGNKTQNTFYPNISEFKNKTDDERLESLVKKLKGIFWRGMNKDELLNIDLLAKIPQLKEFNRYFAFGKYQWYDKFQQIRGLGSHKPVHIVENSLETLDQIQEIAIEATFYAASVFRFVKTI